MRQKSLFAWEHYSQEDVQTALAPIAADLRCVIETSWNDLLRYRQTDPNFRHLPPGGMAQWLHYQIVQQVKNLFPARENAGEDDAQWFVDESGMFHLDFKFAELTFKKLDQDFQRSNYQTESNNRYWTQALIPGMPMTIKLIVGYQWTDETATAIGRIAVVCPSKRGVRWWYEIPAPATVNAVPTLAPEPAQSGIEEESAKGFKIKSKQKTQDKKAAGDNTASYEPKSKPGNADTR